MEHLNSIINYRPIQPPPINYYFQMPRPPVKPIRPRYENLPQELVELRQFIVWKYGLDDAGKPTKHPYTPHATKWKAKSNDSKTWNTYEKALAAVDGFNGLGFMLTAEDPWTVIDLDHCRNKITGVIKSWAWEIILKLNSYTGISPGGEGVHIWITGKVVDTKRKKANVEIFFSGFYLTVTGVRLERTPAAIENRQTELEALHREVFGEPQEQAQESPRSTSPLDLTDLEIIAKAKSAQNGDKFDRLMVGDITGYPSASEADMALCFVLAFWTQDPGQIDRIFRASGLYREKWDRATAGSTYGAITIAKAIAGTTETYQGPRANRNNGKRTRPTGSSAKGGGGTGGASNVAEEAPGPGPVVGFNLTDMGNAQRLVLRHGLDLRFCYPWSKWLVWDGQRWKKDESGEVDRRAKDTVRSIYTEAAAIEEKSLREAMADHARKSESDSKRQAMINSARSEAGVAILPGNFDRDTCLLNVLNGTIDLRTGELRAHRRNDLITKLAQVVYDAKAECPTRWKFLERIFVKNYDLILFLQKAVGYALTGITWEQCLFFLYGLGANGKSTLLEILQALLGDYAKRTSSETFLVKKGGQIPNDIAALRGARFVAAVEVESGRRLAEVLIKEMTGGDTISARFLYSEYFEFDPEFKIFLAANHKPVIRGTDHAIWRRIHLIPFTVQIPQDEQDKAIA